MYWEHPNSKPSDKIACFGFNKSLVSTSIFRRGEEAWTIRYATIPEKLKALHEEGYKLVIFSNYSYIGSAVHPDIKQKEILQQTARCGGLVEILDLPFQIFVATAKTDKRRRVPDETPMMVSTPPPAVADPYRKPAPGMWNFLIQNCNGGIKPDMSKCFYVAGGAGRKKDSAAGRKHDDHTDYDILFAKNAGLTFTPDDIYFDVKKKLPGPSMPHRKPRKLRKIKPILEEEASQ